MNDIKTKPLRVALIISQHTLADYPMLLQNLLVGLPTESVQLALICPPNVNLDSIACGPVELIRHPAIDLPFIERISRRAILRRLAEFEPAVLHCLCRTKQPLAACLAKTLDVPFILTINALQKRWRPFARLSNNCAGIIVPTPTVAANLARFHPRFADKITTINVGTFVAEKSCCYPDPYRIATMVLADPFDNIDDLENIFGAIRHMMLDEYEFMMLIMGAGPGETKLRDLIAALDLQQIVTIIPPMTPCRSVIAAGDIFIQPRPASAFNPFILEAMSVGSAVAASKGGVDDLLVEDTTAVLFDPNDEMTVMAALKQLIDKRQFAQNIAKAAQQYLRDNHSVSNMVAATLQTYRNACRTHKTSRQ